MKNVFSSKVFSFVTMFSMVLGMVGSFPFTAGAVVVQCNAISDYIVSDTTTLSQPSGDSTIALANLHVDWTATPSIPDATWIWNVEPLADPVGDTSETFTKNFSITGTPLGATLDIAADNSYEVFINNVSVGSDDTEFNYTATGKDTISIGAEKFTTGPNTIKFIVKNWAQENGTQESNPAGLLYKLVVNSEDCTPPDVVNTCPVADSLSDGTTENININPNEPSLQSILDGELYGVNFTTDQKQYQLWNIDPGSTVTIDSKFINGFDGSYKVFGYYKDGSMTGSDFVPIFKTGNILSTTDFDSVPLSNTGPFTINTGTATSIGFAIKNYEEVAPGTFIGDFATEISLTSDWEDKVVVYNPESNKYVLAFEDLTDASPSDNDFNDLVVEITLSCDDIQTSLVVADLSITKDVDNATPDEGQSITYTITVTNNGPDEATGVTVNDVLPTGLTYVTSATAEGTYDNDTGIWTIGDLADGASVILSITATVNSGTAGNTLINTATVDGNEDDNTPNDDSSSVSAIVNQVQDEDTDDTDSDSNNSSRSSSGSRRSSSSSNSLVLGASTDTPTGEVLGAEIGLPQTGSGSAGVNTLILILSGLTALVGLLSLNRKSKSA